MMGKPSFKLSDGTRDRILAGLDGLDDVQKSQILSAVADLCAEVEMYARTRTFEELRQQWSEVAATMLRYPGPAPTKK